MVLDTGVIVILKQIDLRTPGTAEGHERLTVVNSPRLSHDLRSVTVTSSPRPAQHCITFYVYYLSDDNRTNFVTSPRVFSGNKNAQSCMHDAAWQSHLPVNCVAVWVLGPSAQLYPVGVSIR